MTDEARNKKINHKQRVFIDEYLRCFNGAEAARRAGYSEKTARITASNLLAEPNINEQVQARLAEVHMSADEAVKLLSDMARGDIAQIMDVSGVGFSLDMKKAQELGLTKLIKKVKQKTTTHLAKSESDEDREVIELEVELYDAQAAIDKILKVHGKYTEHVDISNSDGTLTRIEIIMPKDESN